MNVTIELVPVTAQNEKEICSLHTARGQESFIETVSDCLAEARECSAWHPAWICANGSLVGFCMYGFFTEYAPKGRLWLDRLLISEQYQGLGYGTAALEFLLDLLPRLYPDVDEIYLSVTAQNQTAARLYLKHGFAFNGETDIHQERVMVLKLART